MSRGRPRKEPCRIYAILICDKCNYRQPDDGSPARCVVCKTLMRRARVVIRQGQQAEP